MYKNFEIYEVEFEGIYNDNRVTVNSYDEAIYGKQKDSATGLFLLPFLPCYVCDLALHSSLIYWYFSVFFVVSRSSSEFLGVFRTFCF